MANRRPLLYVDAVILARPVTRTLLIAGANLAGFDTVWSALAEEQANAHLPPGAMSVTELRSRVLQRDRLGPAGQNPGRFRGTQASDRQILADAEAAKAEFLITADVDDFDPSDLAAVNIAAVNPDLFMSVRFPAHAYRHALILLVRNMKNPPRGEAEMHGLIAKQHPLLFTAHADLYPVQPAKSKDNAPAALFRGTHCLRCGRRCNDLNAHGLGPACRGLT